MLRFPATGHSFSNLEADFKIHRTTIPCKVIEVCNAIYDCLKDEHLNIPQTKEDWKHIAEKTQERWHFPNCIGAMDGKHIYILHPKDPGSDFYNYKGFFSIIMLAFVEYDCRFLFSDVGWQGRISNVGVFRNSAFNKELEIDKLNLPEPASLPSSTDPTWLYEQNDPLPYVFVNNEAFPSGKHCIKPYPQTNLSDRKSIFNYRLSRMWRISENVFGICGNRFRVFTTTMALSMANERATALYWWKYVRQGERRQFCDRRTSGNYWRQFSSQFFQNKNNHVQKLTEKVRDIFVDHFYGSETIPL